MTNIDTALVERAKELLVTELRCDGAHLLAGVIENLNDGAILSNPPTSSAIRAIVKALQSTREKKLEVLSDAVKAAYIAGAEAVHDCWIKIDPNGPPDRDPDFGEAASDYAALSDGEREALPVGGEWRDIASAPRKHGEMILSTNRYGAIDTICWNDSFPGWDDGLAYGEDFLDRERAFSPTHWMPLPAPPPAQPAVGEESGE